LQEGGGEVNVELFVERGKTAQILLQGPDGTPLSDVIVSGLTAHWPFAFRLKNLEKPVTVLALDPDRPRRLVFLHPEKKIGGTVTLRGDEQAPVAVKVGPLGAVTGRFLDELDGMPLVDAELSLGFPDEISRELYRFFASAAPAAKTDKEGRFIIPGIIPGVKFRISTPQEQGILQLRVLRSAKRPPRSGVGRDARHWRVEAESRNNGASADKTKSKSRMRPSVVRRT